MTPEELADPIAFAALSLETIAALDDEALLGSAAFVAGHGEEYVADWYDRLGQTIAERRGESSGVGEVESPAGGGEDAATGVN